MKGDRFKEICERHESVENPKGWNSAHLMLTQPSGEHSLYAHQDREWLIKRIEELEDREIDLLTQLTCISSQLESVETRLKRVREWTETPRTDLDDLYAILDSQALENDSEG